MLALLIILSFGYFLKVTEARKKEKWQEAKIERLTSRKQELDIYTTGFT